MNRLATLLISFAISGSVTAQDSLNVSLLFHWMDTTIIPSSLYNNTYNEIWGVKINNREYAIIGATDGTHFFDITDPMNVDTVAFVAGADDGSNIIHRDYHDYNGYLYAVCDEGPSTLQIIDMSFLPDSVIVVYDNDSLIKRSHNIFIDSSSARLYNADGRIFSLANPIDPDSIGKFGSFCHDMFVRNDTLFCNKGNNGLFIYEVSDAANPILIDSLITYPDKAYNHSGWLSDDGSIYVFADEKHGMDIKVCDVSNMPGISILSQINVSSSDTSAIPHNVIIKGDFLFLSYYYDGLQIYNISNPANPVRVGYYDTYALPNLESYKGAWGVYPLLPSGLVLVSDMQTGLYVFDISVATGIEEKALLETSLLYPNPAVNKLTMTTQGKITDNTLVCIYDRMGKLLKQMLVSPSSYSEISIDISELAEGIYVLQLLSEEQTVSHKFVKLSN
ncbi:MAG: hypothetical protein COB85_01005 [Bacteroidetes bacterium]|nr:MAG: hypothetical protein COB85_01005 [Bacteroidota bacterium]